MMAATRDFSSKVRVELMKSFSSFDESWNDSWTWSSPAALSACARAAVRPTPEVMRLV